MSPSSEVQTSEWWCENLDALMILGAAGPEKGVLGVRMMLRSCHGPHPRKSAGGLPPVVGCTS